MEAGDQTPLPLLVMIKCPAPRKTKMIKILFSGQEKASNARGLSGEEMLKLRFDWYITLLKN